MRPRVSARWFGIVIAALSGLVLLLAVAAPAASAGPAGSRGCGRRATCQQEAKRLAELLSALLAEVRTGAPAPQGGGNGVAQHWQPAKAHVVVHIRPIESTDPQDTDDVVIVLHMTMGSQNGSSTGDGKVVPAIPTSTSPGSGLLGSLLNSLLGNSTTVANGVVTTTTGVLNSLLGVTPTPTPSPTPSRTHTEPGPPPSSGGEQPPGQPSTSPSDSSSPRLQVAPLQGPSLAPSRGSTVPAAHETSHHAGGLNLNPASLLSSPSTAILVAAVAAFAVAVFGMVYGAGHRSTGRRHRRPRRAR